MLQESQEVVENNIKADSIIESVKLALSDKREVPKLVKLFLDNNTSPDKSAFALNAVPASSDKTHLLDSLGIEIQRKYVLSSVGEAKRLALIFSKLQPSEAIVQFHLNMFRAATSFEVGEQKVGTQYVADSLRAAAEIPIPEEIKDGIFNLQRLENLKKFLKNYSDQRIPDNFKSDLETIFKGPALDHLSTDNGSISIQHVKQMHYGGDAGLNQLMAIGTSQMALASRLYRSRGGIVLNEASPTDLSEKERSLLKPFLERIFPNGFPTETNQVTFAQLLVATDLGGAVVASVFNPKVKVLAGTNYHLQNLIVDLHEEHLITLPVLTRSCRSPRTHEPMTPLDCGKQVHHSITAERSYVHDIRETEVAFKISDLLARGENGLIAIVYGAAHDFTQAFRLSPGLKEIGGSLGVVELPKEVAQYNKLKEMVGPPIVDYLVEAKSLPEKLTHLERFRFSSILKTRPELLIGAACGENACSPDELSKLKEKVYDLSKVKPSEPKNSEPKNSEPDGH